MYIVCDDCTEENCNNCPYEEYTYDDYLEDRADEEYHRMKDEGEI